MAVRWMELPGTRLSPNTPFGQCLLSATVFVIVVITLLTSLASHQAGQTSLQNGQSIAKRNLHLLMPSDKADARMCKSMYSTLVNGYPAPVLINWGLNESSPEMNGYDMKSGKIWGVLQYLRSLPRSADNELVLMSDAYDVWFQLPPAILISRYDAANARAHARLAREHGPAQTIVFGAEKFCWPRSHRDPACYAVPTSPLRADAYGAQTDGTEVRSQRPRFLNSGLVLGPVADMRALYERVHELWTAEALVNHADDQKANDGDQNIFAEVFGRQEYARQQLRGTSDWAFSFGEAYDESELVRPAEDGRSWEFHVGLDYDGELFQALNEAHMDLSFAVHADRERLATLDREHGTEDIYGSTDESFAFPADLSSLQRRPFVDLAGEDERRRQMGWADVPLVTNFHARSIPVAIHHNGYNRLLNPWWREMWWSAEGVGLTLLQALRGQNVNMGARRSDGTFMGWDEICGAFDRDVVPQDVVPP